MHRLKSALPIKTRKVRENFLCMKQAPRGRPKKEKGKNSHRKKRGPINPSLLKGASRIRVHVKFQYRPSGGKKGPRNCAQRPQGCHARSLRKWVIPKNTHQSYERSKPYFPSNSHPHVWRPPQWKREGESKLPKRSLRALKERKEPKRKGKNGDRGCHRSIHIIKISEGS